MVPTLATLVLFTRMDATGLLSHGLRRGFLDLLRVRPGCTVSQLAGAFGVDYKTALHHVRLLQRAGQLVVVPEGRSRPCFLPGSPKVRPPPPRVVQALRAVGAGAGTPALLGRALRIPRGSAGSLLAALARKGLLARRAEGYVLAEHARRFLATPEAFSAEPGMGGAWSPASSCAR